MTAPRYRDCKCGHSKDHHENPALAPQCTGAGCSCLAYRPDTARDPQPQPSPFRAQQPAFKAPAPPSTIVTDLSPREEPPARPEPEIAVRGEKGPSLEQVLAAGKRSEFKRTVQLTERIAVMLADLRGRLADEREAAEEKRQRDEAQAAARAEVETLEAQLAAAKAKLRGAPKRERSSPAGEFGCPDCDKVLASPQGLGAHRARVHGYRREAS